MEEILSQILDACKLARELDSSLPYVDVASDAHYLSQSCEEIVSAFNKAIHGLYALQSQAPRSVQMLIMDAGEGMGNLLCTGVPAQISPENQPPVLESAGGLSYVNSGAPSGQRKGKSLVKRSSKKRNEGISIELVPAHPTMENPPDDGHTWKKYGQKEILNSRFPRSYYHCTHKHHYGCKAKKKVQRLDDYPSTLEVTYCGAHTCHTSSLTPILIPNELMSNSASNSKNDENTNEDSQGGYLRAQTAVQTGASQPTLIQDHNWFNGDDSNRYTEPMQGGGEVDCSVEEFADGMFNLGNNSALDVIFSRSQQKL